MSDTKQLISEYLKTMRVMQLATSSGNKVWACNVHFYADDNNNLYWISTPTRRHSLDIAINPNVAVTMKIHEDVPEEKYIIGLSAEGQATLLSKEDVQKIGPEYMKKLDKPLTLLEDIMSGENPHQFYKLTVSRFVLFDTKNFPENPRQEVKV